MIRFLNTLQKNRIPQSISISTKHHCITCMKEYENKSLEELRFEDYTCNRKGPRVQPGCGAAPFGTPTSSTPHYFLFEQTDNKTGFGQPQDFGQTPSFGPSTVVFGVPNQTNTFKLNPPSTSNPFSANQTQKTFSQPLFGTTTTQPAFGTGLFEQTNTQNTTTNLFQKTAQTTNGFNTGQPSFSFNQIDPTQASNLFQVSRPNGFGVAPFGTSTSSTSTPGVGQFTLAFGVPNQTNTSSLFSKPSIFESESFIMSELEKRQSEAVGKLKVVEKQRNEMEELLIKIEETKRECKLKEEVHTMLTGKWNVKRSKFDTQIEKLNKKILTLETIIESKEKLIERLVSYFKEERESVSKANLRIGELLNWKINKLKDELSRNNANLDNDADTGTNVLAEIEQFEEKVNPILKLESNLNEEKQKYLDLTVRYEILEEEHVITKAKLVMEKETIENQLSNTKSEFQELDDELKALRKTYNEQHELDQIRLQSLLEGKLSEIDQLKKENEVINDQLEQMRKESDELKKKLDGYEKDSETSFFQENSNNLYGSNAFGKQTTGTVIKFSPVMGTDTIQENGMIQSVSTKYHCITCMKEYENKSLEELRFEDNTCNRKGLQQKPVFQASTVGTPTSSTTNSLCGQTHNTTQFGQPQGFGQLPSFGPSTVAFGVPNKTSTSSRFTTPTTFGTTTSMQIKHKNPCLGLQARNLNPLSVQEYSDKQTLRILLLTCFKNLRRLQLDSTRDNWVSLLIRPAPFKLQICSKFLNLTQDSVFSDKQTRELQDLAKQVNQLLDKPTVPTIYTISRILLRTCFKSLRRLQLDSTRNNRISHLTKFQGPAGVGQSTLTFGVTNQTNTSSVFSEPPIFETEGLKKELKNKTIVADKLCNKLTIMSQFEKEVSEAVDKFKKAFKQGIEMQELLIKIEEVKSELKEEVHTMLTDKWNVERSKFDTQIEKLNKKIFTLETIIESKEKLIERLVGCFKEERESILKANLKIGELQNWKINKLKDELSRNNANLGYDADTGTNVVAEIEQFEEKFNPILELESNLNEEKQKYQNLTVKYEILEEEHVVTKAKLIMEKETMENQLSNMKSEVEKLEAELKALKKTYNEQHQPDQIRLESSLEGKRSELDQLKKENEVINDELEHIRKESDELKEKSNGYEKVNKVTGNISIMNTSDIDNEIRQLEPKSNSIEEPKTLELEECKMNDENKKIVLQKSLTDEIAKAN
ncbi:hypothetical protein GEV33_001952 [Tenebrio molitor]|uniref:Nuclear pore complex protein Nup98-Nup96 n=1 Tax=Tenebrio molitor TaxID=7067 RepID=A0A8J6LFB6_TENMO|nr:hypothetical protein GEV33_001952 [Tenebrio molitor]